MKHRKPVQQQPRRHGSATQSDALPPPVVQQLVTLFNTGQYVELESQARLLVEQYPLSGFAWKVLGISLKIQGKEGLLALQKAADLLPGDVEAHINLGIALNDLGRLDDAVASFRRALKIKPKFAEAHSNLGNALSNLRRMDDAVASYRRALEIKPDNAEVLNNLGNAQSDLGRLADAAVSYRRALEIKPDYAEAHNNLGITLKNLGRLEDAVASYRRAVEIKPDYANAHNNLGVALNGLGHLDDAVASYRRALEIKPDYAEAHSNLGIALINLGRLDDAVASCRRALEIKPDYAEAYNNLGVALNNLGHPEDAEASCRRALEIKPDYAEAHSNLGNALKNLGRFDEAVASYRRALEIKPDHAETHSYLGIALKRLGRLDEALASYRRALEIKPDYAEAHINLGNALQDLGHLDDAVASFRRALEIKPDYTEAYNSLLFASNYLPDQPAEMLLTASQNYGELVARKARPYGDWHNVPDAGRSLRVGWVSGDLSNHPVGYFVESLLATLATDAAGRIELFAYPSHFKTDALTERIKACCHGWHSAVGLSDERLAGRIREDGIDILIDLSGHTAHNRLPLFAWRPAPVQVTWLGYFATTGVAEIDYLIADPWTLPEREEIHFTEKIWRLPETRLCFTPPNVDVPVSPPPALTNGHITFGCFNNLTKMNDAVVTLWARVLQSVTGSRLFLKAKQLGEASVRQSVLDRFAAHGIEGERLILEGASPRAEYLAAYSRVDVALDPFPFTGGTTSAESLWMGVPVLTLAGDRFVSRQGVGLMMNACLPEWIAADADDYVARAVSHAGDLQRLSMLRDGLRQQVLASPIFDAKRFAQYFETALRGMWAQWCARQSNQDDSTQSLIQFF